jgi:hypothetical protein
VTPNAAHSSLQVVAANSSGICFVWLVQRPGGPKQSTNFEPLHRLNAHDRYILRCLISAKLAFRTIVVNIGKNETK